MTGGREIMVAWATDVHFDHAGPEAALSFIEGCERAVPRYCSWAETSARRQMSANGFWIWRTWPA